jgi:predicted RNA binding protein YcfA (HicA-like mRNA interferase family)
MKYSELEKKLKKAGCSLHRNGKSHPIWKSPITGKLFEMSYHGSEEVKNGTLRSIIRESGVKI